jgi:hypothetical protein
LAIPEEEAYLYQYQNEVLSDIIYPFSFPLIEACNFTGASESKFLHKKLAW